MESLKVSDGTTMGAYLSRPKGKGRGAGILVLQEAFGVNGHIRDVADRFAREGFVALAPELFHRTAPGFEGNYLDFSTVMPHINALTEEGLSADLRAAYAFLSKQEGVEAVAALGFCMGGRTSFLAAAILPLKAAVSFYGARIVPALLPRAKDLSCPILMFWGGLDKHIRPEHFDAVAAALRAAGKPFTNVEISDADHGFFNDQRTTYQPRAASQAWALSLAFLSANLL